ncbi:MAG: 2'-5' RNA ligase family protein, partial [Spirochaetales bacterium]
MSDHHQHHRERTFSHENTFRAFIAIDIESDAKKELSHLAGTIKSQCHGSFPTSDMYHMTLAFLGDITLTQADAMCRVLEEVAEKYEPFELKL